MQDRISNNTITDKNELINYCETDCKTLDDFHYTGFIIIILILV